MRRAPYPFRHRPPSFEVEPLLAEELSFLLESEQVSIRATFGAYYCEPLRLLVCEAGGEVLPVLQQLEELAGSLADTGRGRSSAVSMDRLVNLSLACQPPALDEVDRPATRPEALHGALVRFQAWRGSLAEKMRAAGAVPMPLGPELAHLSGV